jgi:hypothetical protein
VTSRPRITKTAKAARAPTTVKATVTRYVWQSRHAFRANATPAFDTYPFSAIRNVRIRTQSTETPRSRRLHDQTLLDASARNESAPETGALPNFEHVTTSGSDLGRFDLQHLVGTRDRDRPRLHRLWDHAHEVNVQEPALQPSGLDKGGRCCAVRLRCAKDLREEASH